MRIPLDYYRILSIPVKATAEQLEQAYGDRLLQQPRREYSAAAIKARQELIKYAYQVLSNSEQRAIYDGQFLLNMQPLSTPEDEQSETTDVENTAAEEDSFAIPSANPTIEISSGQLVGALLLLHELGEYETVLNLGIDFFNSRESEQESAEEEVVLDATQEDLLLCLALAYLELGREQWHRQEYEHAAISGQMGLDLLKQKSLFPHLQTELERDLDRLRPYRILELISQNSIHSAARNQGFQLLQSMLLQRQGIEGKGEDRSGLNFEQFLCFVQQLRTYLTSAEQQQLFDQESQKDSAIANYLAVYALLARGFSLKQPELVLRAQRKLDYLSEKQDVSWEQSIAALLLGHTEKAMEKLRQAPDTSKLVAIQQHSASSSDLLPGLCFYGEQWLQQDVIAQFKDLSTTELTLKEYFAERQVQSFLEELAPPALSTNANPQQAPSIPISPSAAEPVGIMSLWRSIFATEKSGLVKFTAKSEISSGSRELVGATKAQKNWSTSTATIERNPARVIAPGANSSRSSVSPSIRNHPQKSRLRKSPSLPLQPRTEQRAVPPTVMAKAKASRKKASRRQKRSPATLWKGWLFIFSLIFGVGAAGFVLTKLFLAPGIKVADQPQLAIAISNPTVKIPPQEKPKVVAAKPKVTFADQSQQVVQTWLSSKASAFGKEHKIEQLNQILAEPLLTTWRDRVKVYQQENIYREYKHQVTMRSATINPQDQNKATVEAEVKEVAQHYQSGKLDSAQSYDDNLLVRYQLIRKGEKWLINHAEVLKTL
ncbi:MAG: IMS domain-containing protein [Cyanobacteria bacterium P01_G01_bin.67]